jgi:hypothetical protein
MHTGMVICLAIPEKKVSGDEHLNLGVEIPCSVSAKNPNFSAAFRAQTLSVSPAAIASRIGFRRWMDSRSRIQTAADEFPWNV